MLLALVVAPRGSAAPAETTATGDMRALSLQQTHAGIGDGGEKFAGPSANVTLRKSPFPRLLAVVPATSRPVRTGCIL